MKPAFKNLTGAVVVAIAGILFWVFVMPGYDLMQQNKTVLNERKGILEERAKMIQSIANLVSEYQKREADVSRLSSIVPTKKSAAEIVSAVQDISTRTGLQLIGLGLADQKGEESDPYHKVNIDMSLAGSYLSLLSFLETLEKNLRIIDVVSIDATEAAAGNANLGFRVKANAYYLK